MNSQYFPFEVEKATTVFKNSPLQKARASLVRNLIIVLLKKLLKDTNDFKAILRITTALNAIDKMYREIYSETLRDKFSDLIKEIDDSNLFSVNSKTDDFILTKQIQYF